VLDSVFGAVPGLEVEDLYEERRRDEGATKRKYGL
jgi:hypothetical protein